MSDLPDGWELLALGDVASWGSGGTPTRTVGRYYGGDIPWAVIGDLNDGVVSECATAITDDGLRESSAKLVPPGAVLIAMYGSIGKLGIAGVEMATNQAIAFATPVSEVLDQRYLFHYLASQRDGLTSAGKGATQQNIGQAVLKAWPIPVPPFAEQERIVAAIEEHLSRIDAARAAIESARRRLSSLWEACLREVFEPGWPRAELASMNIQDRPICYGILKPKTPDPGVIPYVEVRSIAKGRIKVDELHKTTAALHASFPRSVLRTGDVVLAVRGSFDRAAVVPQSLDGANVSRDVARISPTAHLLPEFLAAFLVSPEARSYFAAHARGVAVRGVNIGDLRRLPVPAPDIVDQRSAIARIQSVGSANERIQVEIETAERRARLLRRSVLAAAFSGDLLTQDPGDGSTSAVLDHVRADRSAATRLQVAKAAS